MGGTEGGKEGGGGSKVTVGEGTRGGRERRKEGGRGNKGRDGESKGRERGSKDATQERSVSGGREG